MIKEIAIQWRDTRKIITTRPSSVSPQTNIRRFCQPTATGVNHKSFARVKERETDSEPIRREMRNLPWPEKKYHRCNHNRRVEFPRAKTRERERNRSHAICGRKNGRDQSVRRYGDKAQTREMRKGRPLARLAKKQYIFLDAVRSYNLIRFAETLDFNNAAHFDFFSGGIQVLIVKLFSLNKCFSI